MSQPAIHRKNIFSIQESLPGPSVAGQTSRDSDGDEGPTVCRARESTRVEIAYKNLNWEILSKRRFQLSLAGFAVERKICVENAWLGESAEAPSVYQ